MKIVLDTNVLVSGILSPNGPPAGGDAGGTIVGVAHARRNAANGLHGRVGDGHTSGTQAQGLVEILRRA